MKVKIDPTKLNLNPLYFTADNCIFSVDRITSDGRFVIYTPSEIYLNSGEFEIVENRYDFTIETELT